MPKRSQARITKPVPEQKRAEASYAAELQALYDQMAPRLTDMDPHVLLQILDALLRPIGSNSGRRFLLRRGEDGGYAP